MLVEKRREKSEKKSKLGEKNVNVAHEEFDDAFIFGEGSFFPLFFSVEKRGSGRIVSSTEAKAKKKHQLGKELF